MTKLISITRSALSAAAAAVCVGGQSHADQFVNAVFEHAENRTNDEGEDEGVTYVEQPGDNRIYPAYSAMINQLFKQLPEMPHASTLHAAIGISGEVAELAGATDRHNIIEECGDLEFYMEALKQRFEQDYLSAIQETDSRSLPASFAGVTDNLVSVAGDILDIVKKSWVYGKELDLVRLTRYIIVLEINLDLVYEFIGVERCYVQHLNQVKLIGPGGRFESGFYSDSAAIARKDKEPVGAPGADRSFLGKV